MAWAEFEEKQYETYANHELQLSSSYCFPVGPVLESALNFDAAFLPLKSSSVWPILETRIPKGVHLSPSFWWSTSRNIARRLPTKLISLIIQYKRPEFFFKEQRSKQKYIWNSDYYRIHLENKQHRSLLSLEKKIKKGALVRYAAPTFWTWDELDSCSTGGTVLKRTNFVSPGFIGSSHQVWTYATSGIKGYANPEPEQKDSESYEIFKSLIKEKAEEENPYNHLENLRYYFDIPSIQSIKAPWWMSDEYNKEGDKYFSLLIYEISKRIIKIGARWIILGF